MNESIQEIAMQIKLARKKKGISQRELSAKVGIPQSHISKIEQGLVDLQTSTLIQIARALELELMLVSRIHLTIVEAIQNQSSRTESLPAYQLSEGDEDG